MSLHRPPNLLCRPVEYVRVRGSTSYAVGRVVLVEELWTVLIYNVQEPGTRTGAPRNYFVAIQVEQIEIYSIYQNRCDKYINLDSM